MRIKTFIAVTLLILLLGSNCLAFQSALDAGIREGAALGLILESGHTKSPQLRLGFEANTSSSTSSIIFIGGKWFIGDLGNRYPLFLSVGLAGYLGNNPVAGPYVSYICERFLDVEPLFLEFGVDLTQLVILQFRVGYYL